MLKNNQRRNLWVKHSRTCSLPEVEHRCLFWAWWLRPAPPHLLHQAEVCLIYSYVPSHFCLPAPNFYLLSSQSSYDEAVFKHCSVAVKKYSSILLSKAEKQPPLGKKAVMFSCGTGLSVPCISSWLAGTAFLALVLCLGLGEHRKSNS